MVSTEINTNAEKRNSPSPTKKPECDGSNSTGDYSNPKLNNTTKSIKLNPVQMLFEKMKQPLVESGEASPKKLSTTKNVSLNATSVQVRKNARKLRNKHVPTNEPKVPKDQPDVPSVRKPSPTTKNTSPKRTSPRFKQTSPPAVQNVSKRSSSRLNNDDQVKLKTDLSKVQKPTAKTKKMKGNRVPKKLTRAQFKYLMEMTTKTQVKSRGKLEKTPASKSAVRVNKKGVSKVNGIQKRVTNPRRSVKNKEQQQEPEPASKVDIENIKAEWDDDLPEDQTANTNTSVSPRNSSKTSNMSKSDDSEMIDEKENSKSNRIVHPPEFTKIRKYTRKASKSSTLFDNLKENTENSTVVEKPKDSPSLPHNDNLNGDGDEDDDSDAASTAEWMPEDYAEYKFKYSVKKLTNYKPVHKCKICLVILPSYYKLNKHLKIHLTQENPYVCNQCNDAFSVVEDLTAHIRSAHQGKHPYQCKKCNKGFWSKKNLESHMPVHVLRKTKQPNKRFKCERCGKEFGKLCDMERHTRVHTGEKPCICNICQKRFQQAHNLSKHLLTHLHVKPFHCEICNKQFGRNDVLNRHLLTHSIEKPFKCNTCSKGFIRESQLTHHMNKQHLDTKPLFVDCNFVEMKD